MGVARLLCHRLLVSQASLQPPSPMRYSISIATVLALASGATAQNCVYLPSNTPTGNCNVIPFGDNTGSSTWLNQRCQIFVPKTSIGAAPYIIRSLAFASCGTGQRTFDSLKITFDHIAAPTLSNTFASNLSASAQLVLDVAGYGWENSVGLWSSIGLQNSFLFDPALGNLVIDIEARGGRLTPTTSPAGFAGSSGFQRVYAFGWTGSPPASGSSDQAGLKVQLCADLAYATPFGAGCKGGNSLVPALGYPVAPKLGASTFSIDLAQAAASSVAFLLFGVTNAAPGLPIDLTVINMPGCTLYVSQDIVIPFATSAAGAGSVPLPIANSAALIGVRVFNQSFVVDPGANGLGFAASNPGWFLVGS